MFDNIKYVVIISLTMSILYLYVSKSSLEKEVVTLNNDKTLLKQNVKNKDNEIIRIKSEISSITTLKDNIQLETNEQQVKINELNSKLKKHSLSKLSSKKPKLVQKIINKGTFDEFRCIENISKGLKNECK